MRYLLGLAATDGRLIRPKDEPTTAKVAFDWYEVLSEGWPERGIARGKWIVKRRELELIAAKNFLLPSSTWWPNIAGSVWATGWTARTRRYRTATVNPAGFQRLSIDDRR